MIGFLKIFRRPFYLKRHEKCKFNEKQIIVACFTIAENRYICWHSKI